MDLHKVILYPVMTESASLMVEKENKLVFIINLKARKKDVKRAIEELYDVKVEKINLLERRIDPRGDQKPSGLARPEQTSLGGRGAKVFHPAS